MINIRLKPLYLFISFCWLWIHAASAQGVVELQFVSFPRSLNAKPVELLIGEGKTIPVEMPTNSISPVYKVKALSKWVVGKSSVNDEGEPTFDVYGQAPAISSTKQLVLVIRKGKDDASGLKLIPMDYSQVGFGGGKYLLLNAANIDIAGSVGTADDWFTFVRDGFDMLYREGATHPKMMSVGLHMRLIGHPARAIGLERLLDHMMKHEGVWITRRVDIAQHWIDTHPYPGKGLNEA